jgi:hypothetical protein
MSTAKFIPAETKTKTVEVAPAKVLLELTVEDAARLRALLGRTSSGAISVPYRALTDLAQLGRIPYMHLSESVPTIKLGGAAFISS